MLVNDLIGVEKGARVVVAMSGGVDSSVTAALLKERGYDVVGITLQLYDHGAAVEKEGACCAGRDIYDARHVADKIGIPHYVLDFEQRFKEAVIDTFADTYLSGETPIPCVRCNETVKFKDLLQVSRDLGATAMITGHYAQRIETSEGPELHRGADPKRDQSYFLFSVTRDQLGFVHFPLGSMLDKEQTRAEAERLELPVARKPDSQDICFVPQGRYTDIIEKLRPGSIKPGRIVHVDGTDMGEHKGMVFYTVGQRRGLGIGGGDPLYVVRLDAEQNHVIVGPKEALQQPALIVRDINWLLPDQPKAPLQAKVKLRSMHNPVDATIVAQPDGSASVKLDEPQSGIAPGQACVIYQGDRVLGGGWITGRQSC